MAYDFAINGKILATDYDDLVTFSGLNIHTINDWMHEVLERHAVGIAIVNAMSRGEALSRFVPSSVPQRSATAPYADHITRSHGVPSNSFFEKMPDLATSSGFENSFAANVERQNQESTTPMFVSSTPKPTPSPAMKPVVSRTPDVRASNMPTSSSAQRKPQMFFKHEDSDDFAQSRPAALSRLFKGDWTECFRINLPAASKRGIEWIDSCSAASGGEFNPFGIKAGDVIHHTPECAQIRGIWNAPEATCSCRSSYNRFPLQNGEFTLGVNSTRDEFVAKLKKSDIL